MRLKDQFHLALPTPNITWRLINGPKIMLCFFPRVGSGKLMNGWTKTFPALIMAVSSLVCINSWNIATILYNKVVKLPIPCWKPCFYLIQALTERNFGGFHRRQQNGYCNTVVQGKWCICRKTVCRSYLPSFELHSDLECIGRRLDRCFQRKSGGS